MTDTYYEATGVLVLDKVTPLITALFGGFKLDAANPGNGNAYIARSWEEEPTWSDVLQRLRAFVSDLRLSLPRDVEGTMQAYLSLLGSHFNANNSTAFTGIVERNVFSVLDSDDSADLGILFEIAVHLNDGHNLRAMQLQGCWYCTLPVLWAFGGDGQYFGRHCYLDTTSDRVLTLGSELDAALESGALDRAANRLAAEIDHTLSGISNEKTRNVLCGRVGKLLLAREGTHPKLKWFAVTGRIPGDDEDTCHIFQAANREEALAAFERTMWEDETQARRKSVWNEYGHYVFVNSVFTSDSPIADAT